jgi:pilus assembly protein Flp/PilA
VRTGRLWLHELLAREAGQGLIEYALILVLVAIVVVVVLALLGHQIENAFRDIGNTLQGP